MLLKKLKKNFMHKAIKMHKCDKQQLTTKCMIMIFWDWYIWSMLPIFCWAGSWNEDSHFCSSSYHGYKALSLTHHVSTTLCSKLHSSLSLDVSILHIQRSVCSQEDKVSKNQGVPSTWMWFESKPTKNMPTRHLHKDMCFKVRAEELANPSCQ